MGRKKHKVVKPYKDGYIRSRDILRGIIRECHKYDVLADVSTIRYIPAAIAGADVTPHDRGIWQCAHNIAFDLPCTKCERYSYDRFVYIGENTVVFMIADTRVYVAAKLYRIREVLKKLGIIPQSGIGPIGPM